MIPKQPPAPGTVLRYNYLWAREAASGREEGTKDRPVALMLAQRAENGQCVVVPITHSPPDDAATAIEIPEAERVRLGLDLDRAWIVVSEFNAFRWPGFDLRAVPSRRPAAVVYGELSRGPFTRALEAMKTLLRKRTAIGVPRT